LVKYTYSDILHIVKSLTLMKGGFCEHGKELILSEGRIRVSQEGLNQAGYPSGNIILHLFLDGVSLQYWYRVFGLNFFENSHVSMNEVTSLYSDSFQSLPY
jgi:hypothetical protein